MYLLYIYNYIYIYSIFQYTHVLLLCFTCNGVVKLPPLHADHSPTKDIKEAINGLEDAQSRSVRRWPSRSVRFDAVEGSNTIQHSLPDSDERITWLRGWHPSL